MRVVDHEALQTLLRLHQQARGTRRHGSQSGAFSDLFLEQGAMRGAVENADAAGVIQREEALAALLRQDLADRAVA